MGVREVKVLGDPLLRVKCEPITDFKAAKPLVEDLRDTLAALRKQYGMGRGLAAPQIGASQRAIYVMVPEYEGEMLNPKMIGFGSEGGFECWDSCFSAKVEFFAKVRRWIEVTVEFQTLTGETRTMRAEGKFGELLQHEIDHLDSILFVDKAQKNGEWLIMRDIWEERGRPFEAK